jgi:hypothetical protein
MPLRLADGRTPLGFAWANHLPQSACATLAAVLIVVTGLLHLGYLLSGQPLDLAPDEAHYWDWSRHLDWSYYSKGPLVAWLIRGSCEVFGSLSILLTGNLGLAVRLPAIVCGSLLVWSLYLLTVRITSSPRLALAVVVFALTFPLIAVGTTVMTIDSPYTCCWGWALFFAHRAIHDDRLSDWVWLGLMIGLGILAKYTMVVFLPCLVLFLLTSPATQESGQVRSPRAVLWSPGFLLMLAVVMICCLPIVIWNAQNGWVTVYHVRRLAGLAAAGEASLREGRGLDLLGPARYLAMQMALLLGWWFLAWAMAAIVLNPWRHRDAGLAFLWWFSVPMFALFFAFSLKTGGGEPNWPITAYLSGGILLSIWVLKCLSDQRAWLRRCTFAGILGMAILGPSMTLLAHCSEQLHPLMEKLAGPPTAQHPFPVRRLDPTCRLRGWQHLAKQIDKIRAELRITGQEPILAGISWAIPGEVGFYCEGRPQVYSVGLVQGDRHSQYDHWENPIDHPERFFGRTFIIIGHPSPETLRAFTRVERRPDVVYELNGRPLASWGVTIAEHFRGFGKVVGAAH